MPDTPSVIEPTESDDAFTDTEDVTARHWILFHAERYCGGGEECRGHQKALKALDLLKRQRRARG